MASRRREGFDVVSGLRDLREMIGGPGASMVREASGVATLTGLRVGPSLRTPLIHPVALGPRADRTRGGDIVVGVAAIAVGLAALCGIVALAALGPGDHPTVGLAGQEGGRTIEERAADPVAGPPLVAASGVAAIAYDDGEARPAAGMAKEAPAASPVEDRAGVDARARAKEKRSARKHRRQRREAVSEAPAARAGIGEAPAKRSLSRIDLKRGLAAVTPKVRSCGKGQGGVVLVELVIGSDGKVRRATPVGQMAGSPTGRCVARAASRARFSPFSEASMTVKYPFIL